MLTGELHWLQHAFFWLGGAMAGFWFGYAWATWSWRKDIEKALEESHD